MTSRPYDPYVGAPRRVALVGATGSIGRSTLEVIRNHPHRLQLVAVAANRNKPELEAICQEFGASHHTLYQRDGLPGLIELVTRSDIDIVVMAAVGTVGLQPTLAAIAAGKDIALASKEILVMAGHIVMAAAARHRVRILPVDSEHNAIFQCVQGMDVPRHIRRLLLTASGGPFRTLNRTAMANVTPADALAHPNWSMGPKITVDSASMANKGLEMMEARWLFGVTPSQVEVVIHPQSIVHSMVECVDGSILAQLSPPSMTFAIQHALLFPDRATGTQPTLDFGRALDLSFSPPDPERFPCLALARAAMTCEGVAPAVFNAANEVAVAAFLENRIGFLAIPAVIEHCLSSVQPVPEPDLVAVLEADADARSTATNRLPYYTR
jgi:1-deoxy-D-xylulose-5-phosphate reductoisomerase